MEPFFFVGYYLQTARLVRQQGTHMNVIDPDASRRMNFSRTDLLDARPSHRPVNTLLGDSAILTDGEFSLTDSAEEISLHMAHQVEDKHHAERKIRGDHVVPRLSPTAILAYFEQAREDDAQAKLDELAAHILLAQIEPRDAILQFSNNAARQFLALQYVINKGEQNRASEDRLAELAEALAELAQQHGSAVRAGLNTIDAAASYARNASDVVQFEQTYHDIVLGEATLAKTLSVALSRFGGQRIAEGLLGLIQALGLDLAAARPSISTTRIRALLTDMHHLRVAVTILDECQTLATRLAATVGKALDQERLMQDIVGISGDKWISASRFLGLTDDHGIRSVPDRIAFLSSVRAMLKDLPIPIYSDDEARNAVLGAAQYALDTAIDEEPL